MRTCPKCRQLIQEAAALCRYCRAWVGPVPAGTLARHPEASGKAIVSLVMGVTWFWGIGSVLALIFGFLARGEIDHSQGALTGGGLATAGIILGFLGLGLVAGLAALLALAP